MVGRGLTLVIGLLLLVGCGPSGEDGTKSDLLANTSALTAPAAPTSGAGVDGISSGDPQQLARLEDSSVAASESTPPEENIEPASRQPASEAVAEPIAAQLTPSLRTVSALFLDLPQDPPETHRLLVLPDADGQVLGVDQVFASGTVGPDGELAANGFAALAKYDGMSADGMTREALANGRIDQSDAVFARLRLWLDKNSDGVVQPDELVTLEEAGIAYIDLNASNAYPEADAYGNESLLKSVVGMADGSIDLIFDMSFGSFSLAEPAPVDDPPAD